MNEVVGILDDLVTKFKGNGKLSAADKEQAERHLCGLLQDSVYWEGGLDYMFALPPSVGTKAVADAWRYMEEDIKLLFFKELSKSLDQARGSGYLRQIHLVKHFSENALQLSFILFMDLCEKITDFSNQMPSGEKLLATITQILLNSNVLLRAKLSEMPFTDKQFSCLILVSAACLIQKQQSDVNADLRMPILLWLVESGRKAIMPNNLKYSFETATSDLVDEARNLMFSLGLLQQMNKSKSSMEPINRTSTVINEATAQKISVFNKDEWFKQVSQLKNYVEDIETKIAASTKAASYVRNELEAEVRKRKEQEIKIQEYERKNYEYSIENRDLLAKINTLVENNKELVILQGQKEREYEIKLVQLIEMSEQESTFASREFKRKLSGLLKWEYADLMEIKSDDMSLDLGGNLRLQLLKVFDLLIKEGIEL
ncbi:hypothetical protein SAMN03159341_101433 [Paenibacillus sp. 1_12]|uniref:hypothetical protein n=1 Tax=Paenibacillus sp. 1_12 TaxID=1566278 RepID=UPI0008F18CFE|nr:hypothetical protein [Paenibacillus sp. 1_12]SFK75709.1 hypothetical protein SAMN03159341_101433 [Paenibacillus sp. 1_12]